MPSRLPTADHAARTALLKSMRYRKIESAGGLIRPPAPVLKSSVRARTALVVVPGPGIETWAKQALRTRSRLVPTDVIHPKLAIARHSSGGAGAGDPRTASIRAAGESW